MAPIITLLTDFGIKDGYVASMKGVILGICPEAVLVDISHLVAPQDVRGGAYLLSTVYRDFPKETVHLAVVDPGVGTARRALALRTDDYFFVGPDNGLFSTLLKGEADWHAYSLENPQYWRSTISSTFHGRDIFAPVAAHLAKGVAIDRLGTPCTPVHAKWGSIFFDEDVLHGEVAYIDHFGNIITNFTREVFDSFVSGRPWTIRLGPHRVTRFSRTYDQVASGETVALVGGSNHIELAVNHGDAAGILEACTGDPVTVQIEEKTP